MNVRLITGLIFVLIIVGGLGLFFMNKQNTKELSERISPTQTVEDPDLPKAVTATSSDERVTFLFPESWIFTDTTKKGTKGEFGPIVQTWELQNAPTKVEGQPGMPQNTVKITVEIQSGGGNLPIEDLVDCGMKSTSCEKVGIDNEQFIRNEQTLNTGMKSISIATFYDDKILRMSAQIAPGDEQGKLTESVNAIFESIKFLDIPHGES